MALNRVVGAVVVYRTGMVTVTGSKHSNYFFNPLLLSGRGGAVVATPHFFFLLTH